MGRVCLICDTYALPEASYNVFLSVTPHSGLLLVTLIQRVTRLSFKNQNLDESYVCMKCYELLERYDLTEHTGTQLRNQILEYVNRKHPIDQQFIDVACQTEELLNRVKEEVINDGIRIKVECMETSENYIAQESVNEENKVESEKNDEEYYMLACDVCNQKFEKLAEFKKHHRKCSKDKKHKCDHCSKVYTKKMNLKKHIKKVHGPTVNQNIPENNTSDNNSSLVPTDLLESTMKTEENTDELGNKTYDSFDDDRYASDHSNSSKESVKIKGQKKKGRKKKKDKDDLSQFPRIPKFKCPECPKLFLTNSLLKGHLSVHSDIKPHVCEICGIAYKKQVTLKVHLDMHKGINPFKCTTCDKVFTTKGALKRHCAIHIGIANYQCYMCGKQFIHKTSYDVHILSHTGLKAYKCEVCGLALMSTSHLNRHMRVHSGEKRYACPVCGKRCAERYNLQAHMRMHSSTPSAPPRRTFPCPLCGEAFNKRQKLEEHLVNSHNKVTESSLQPVHF